jgi:hypothetical protein
MAASVTHLPPVTPEPVPAGLLLPLAVHNLRRGMTSSWVRPRWSQMADLMEALEAAHADVTAYLEAAPQ